MSQIKYKKQTSKFLSMETESYNNNEDNDCSIKAIAIACNIPYNKAHAAVKKQGRKSRKGTYTWQTLRAIKALGFIVTKIPPSTIIRQYPAGHCKLKNVTTHHPDRFNKVWADGRSYIFKTCGHMLAVVNGVNHDYTRSSACHVKSIYRIERK